MMLYQSVVKDRVMGAGLSLLLLSLWCNASLYETATLMPTKNNTQHIFKDEMQDKYCSCFVVVVAGKYRVIFVFFFFFTLLSSLAETDSGR